jgi:hypothetical protein
MLLDLLSRSLHFLDNKTYFHNFFLVFIKNDIFHRKWWSKYCCFESFVNISIWVTDRRQTSWNTEPLIRSARNKYECVSLSQATASIRLAVNARNNSRNSKIAIRSSRLKSYPCTIFSQNQNISIRYRKNVRIPQIRRFKPCKERGRKGVLLITRRCL